MFIKLQKLSIEADGRYATDDELQFATGYVQSFRLRIQAYNKIRETEKKIVEEVYTKMRASDPKLFYVGGEDMTDKWKRDTIRVLRFAALTVLLDDPDNLKEQFLYWFQTIMRAFSTERSCNATYNMMQEVTTQYLEPSESALLSPILELSRTILSS